MDSNLLKATQLVQSPFGGVPRPDLHIAKEKLKQSKSVNDTWSESTMNIITHRCPIVLRMWNNRIHAISTNKVINANILNQFYYIQTFLQSKCCVLLNASPKLHSSWIFTFLCNSLIIIRFSIYKKSKEKKRIWKKIS